MKDAIRHCGIEENTVFSIGQFAILWGMIEDKFCRRYCTSRQLIELRFDPIPIGAVYLASGIVRTLREYYADMNEIIEKLRFRSNDGEACELVSRFALGECLDEISQIRAALCICLRVRNNMFHGEKVFWLLNHQTRVFDVCSDFLNALLENETRNI